jgi:hypothetical protein
VRPYVTFDRDVVASTPALGAIESRYTISLRRGDEVCVRPVTLTGRSQLARFRVLDADGPPVPPLEITARAPGYEAKTTLSGYDAPGDQIPPAKVEAPDRELRGEVCARNTGSEPVELIGTDEIRSQVPAETLLNGEPQPNKEIELTLLEDRKAGLIERPGDLVEHARTLTADFAPEWLLWIVLVLVVAGIPIGAIAGLYLSVRRG